VCRGIECRCGGGHRSFAVEAGSELMLPENFGWHRLS